ncbi:MAG: flavin reductase [Bacilli bacterium]|nr:flavin reductase [Bacilli bacterium]
MKDKTITRKISQGVYVLTTLGGGCVVDAVSQISAGDNPLICVAVMKKNNTNELMHNNNKFAISVLGKNVDPKIIETYGMKSMKDYDKFSNSKTTIIDDLNIIDDSLGYMICEKVDTIENDTHTLFIGRLIEADKYSDDEVMTYAYYQEHKDELIKVTTEKGKTAWICTICNYVVYEDELPENFTCPQCGVPKSLFKKGN